jgi:hypothetical protein
MLLLLRSGLKLEFSIILKKSDSTAPKLGTGDVDGRVNIVVLDGSQAAL